MSLDTLDSKTSAEIEEAIRRAEVRWRAWELGPRSDEVATLLARGLEHAEEHLRSIGFTR